MKTTMQPPNGTSFHGQVIYASVEELKAVLGEQTYTSDITDKVQNEWVCETSEGFVITVYDWKEYRSYTDEDVIEWHIGAKGSMHAITGRDELQAELDKLNKLTLITK